MQGNPRTLTTASGRPYVENDNTLFGGACRPTGAGGGGGRYGRG